MSKCVEERYVEKVLLPQMKTAEDVLKFINSDPLELSQFKQSNQVLIYKFLVKKFLDK